MRAAAPPRRGEAPTRDLREVLTRLLAVDDRHGWVVSCYQKLEPADRAGEKYRIKLKNRLRRAAQRLDILGFSRGEREAVTGLLHRVEQFFRFPSNLEGARGVAVFAARDFFQVVPLPYVLRSRVLVDRTPVVSELVALVEAGSRVLAVVADRRSARFFEVGYGGAQELEGMVAVEATRAARYHPEREVLSGFGEYRFHNRIREEKHRHLARVAESVAGHFKARAFEALVLGGIGVDAQALLPHLAPELRARVLGVLKLAPRRTTAAVIRERAMELLAQSAATQAAAAAQELHAQREGGWTTNGIEATLRALARGQVRTLIVDHDAVVPGFRCAGSGRLTEQAAGCGGEGEPLPVADLLDDAIESALRQRARVAVVSGAPARRFDRLAGILRFRAAR